MPDIVVDGVRYVPEGDARPSIGVGITTHNRYDTFVKAYAEIQRFTPGAKIVVVDDASAEPVPDATFRFDENVGIARAKNKCLELLDDCDHIFLFDDDAYPLVDEWWKPYVESPEPHLMRIFLDRRRNTVIKVADDERHVAYSGANGFMLYVQRHVLDVAGGMDPGFGRWGFEHPDWSNRIHAHGLTTWRFADVRDSHTLIHSMDEHKEVQRSVDVHTRESMEDANRARELAQRDQPIRYDYRERRDTIVTPLLTGQPDHKTKRPWPADTKVLAALRKSVRGHRFVVLHDELTENSQPDMELHHVPVHGLNPYLQRWVCAWQWLRDQHDVGFVWFVDGSDVELLRDPFPEMEPGRLYVGSEPSTVDKPWMLEKHPNPMLLDFFREHGHRQLLNAGLVGGDYDTVLRFLHAMVRTIWDNQTSVARNPKNPTLGLGDMGLLNFVAYTQFADELVIGPRVNTVFKANERPTWSWWKHK